MLNIVQWTCAVLLSNMLNHQHFFQVLLVWWNIVIMQRYEWLNCDMQTMWGSTVTCTYVTMWTSVLKQQCDSEGILWLVTILEMRPKRSRSHIGVDWWIIVPGIANPVIIHHRKKIVPFNFCKGLVKACKGLVNVLYSCKFCLYKTFTWHLQKLKGTIFSCARCGLRRKATT